MQDIKEELFKMQDKEYQKFHSKLCPNVDNIIGVRIPLLRKMAKQIAKENARDFLKHTQVEYYEEKMLYGFVIGYQKNITIQERLAYLDQFVLMIDNWAVCDCSCSTFKFTLENLKIVWKYLKKYQKSNREYELRFLIIMLMDYYLVEEYIDEVLEIYNKIQHDGYYVKMAVAWAISVCYVKFPSKTMAFLKNNHLDDFTYNKAIQKMIESYRIEKEIKEKLRNMKRIAKN
ncbi:MAG: DNA alkylation repair protein [Clostridia bacterium]|nr:DNA alkylation repair protein [Clostridia bacterium]